ncbi:hypothetical protein BJY00DRAFT_162099 [Aspergillus carlsbadensis]|nr:hypothetical protein BJY00DRAFT_162099 [Aspergillus carlsbadensis]
MLDQLPLEILHLIVGEVSCIKDLVSLSEASKILHRSVLPSLYKTTVIRADESYLEHLEIPQVKPIFGTDDERTIINILPYVKHLHFVSQINEKTRKRCYSDGYIAHPHTKDHWRENRKSHFSSIGYMDANVRFGLFHFPIHSLESFPWNMGCCIPPSLSGENNWLASRQSRLKALSLVTDGTCYDDCQDFGGLLSLSHLRSFSWRGFDNKCARTKAVIRQTLRLNTSHLEVLELEPLSDDTLEAELALWRSASVLVIYCSSQNLHRQARS